VSTMSADDLLTDAVGKTNALNTIRIDMERLTEEGGELSERITTDILQVGDVSYVARSTELRVDVHWQVVRNRSSERLLYEGKLYSRSVSGRWEREWFDSDAGVGARLFEEGSKRQLPRSLPYGVDFDDLRDLGYLGNETLDESPVLHLTGTLWPHTLGGASEDVLNAISALPAGSELVEHLKVSFSSASIDIWIGAEDQLLKQYVIQEELLWQGEVVKRIQTTVRLSRFNEELQIPGGLPDS
jgi:hypothetical protein